MLGFLVAVCHVAGVTSWTSVTSCVLGTHGQASRRYQLTRIRLWSSGELTSGSSSHGPSRVPRVELWPGVDPTPTQVMEELKGAGRSEPGGRGKSGGAKALRQGEEADPGPGDRT